jgi:hypothetical protein
MLKCLGLENTGATSGQEPVSGKQGKGTIDEPFDQGNAGGMSRESVVHWESCLTSCGHRRRRVLTARKRPCFQWNQDLEHRPL